MKENANDIIRSKKIDRVINDIYERNPVKLLDYTPSVLVERGIKNLPIYENPSHIRKNILTRKDAKRKGIEINERDHYHGLGKQNFINAINNLNNPRVIFKNIKSNNEYIFLTSIKDDNGNTIIIPIEIETTTIICKHKIEINRIKTIYGYDIKNPNLNKYIKYNIKNNIFKKIYEKKERGTGNSTAASS